MLYLMSIFLTPIIATTEKGTSVNSSHTGIDLIKKTISLGCYIISYTKTVENHLEQQIRAVESQHLAGK